MLCLGAYADTITINWGVDNQLYTTTTCEIGGDVILPPVSKRGYIFRGWLPEHFDRGTFTTFANVPTNTNLYKKDYFDNRIPKENDYIIVENASNYVDVDNRLLMEAYLSGSARYLRITDNKTVIKDAVFNSYNFPNNSEYGTNVRVKIIWTDSNNSSWIALTKLKENYTVYEVGDTLFNLDRYFWPGYTYNFSKYADYSGKWRFIYHGIWEIDGKNGWKPDYQISNE